MAYIDVVAVKKAVKNGALTVKVINGNILLADVKSGEAAKIGELPVVRCKDCKYWWKVNELCTHEKCCDGCFAVVDAAADHYCGYGERKEQ